MSKAPTTGRAAAPLCRFGVNVHTWPVTNFDTGALRIGWYIDYAANATPAHPNGAVYAPVIRLSPDRGSYTYSPSGAALDAAIAGNPGADWYIGNEPDRRKLQDNMPPELYAQAYHELYYYIKSKDPTAHIVAGAIVQPTPLRIQYLDLVLKAYAGRYNQPMPADAWAIHNFILNERSCAYYQTLDQCWGADIPPGIDAIDGLIIENTLTGLQQTISMTLFRQQVERMRQWMYDRGYRDKPLYLSEYGVLMPDYYGFPVAKVNQFMNDTFNYLLTATDAKTGYAGDNNRLVQRLSWYSTNDLDYNGSLFQHLIDGKPTNVPPFEISPMGANYQAYTAALTDTSNLTVGNLQYAPALAGEQPMTLTLSAIVANSGNQVAPSEAKVRFYLGDPNQGGEQIGADQVVTVAGCGATAVAQVEWKNVDPIAVDGRRIFVRVVPSGADEGTGAKSVSRDLFTVTSQAFLPTIARGIP